MPHGPLIVGLRVIARGYATTIGQQSTETLGPGLGARGRVGRLVAAGARADGPRAGLPMQLLRRYSAREYSRSIADAGEIAQGSMTRSVASSGTKCPGWAARPWTSGTAVLCPPEGQTITKGLCWVGGPTRQKPRWGSGGSGFKTPDGITPKPH
jgi:hypothetical protein